MDNTHGVEHDKKTPCIYFRPFDLCTCNNDPDDEGECVYELGIEPSNPAAKCRFYKPSKDPQTGGIKQC